MRLRVFSVFLLLFIAPLSMQASWNWFNFPQYVRAADFYNAHLGLVSFGEIQGPLMRLTDSTLTGVSDRVVQQIVIQDSERAWASDNINILLGTAKWSIWTQTSITLPGL